jgi:uncharacterized protein YjiS (DUF1127 family)
MLQCSIDRGDHRRLRPPLRLRRNLRRPHLETTMSFIDTLLAGLERRRRAARTRFELEQLSDRDLADLGIVRADIARLARESAAAGTLDIHAWRTAAASVAALGAARAA